MSRPDLSNFEHFNDLVPLAVEPSIPSDDELDVLCDRLMRAGERGPLAPFAPEQRDAGAECDGPRLKMLGGLPAA